MRNFLLLLTPVMLLCAAEKAPARDASRSKAATAASAAPAPARKAGPAVIPAGAVEVEPYLFRHTDADGKVWFYRKTPFGISKISEQAQQQVLDRQAQAAGALAKVRFTDLGDTVRFERQTPMGNQSWVKKKSELTPEEKSWMTPATQSASTPGK